MDEPVVPSTKLWCDHCNRLLASDEAVDTDGRGPHCPHCGHEVGENADATHGGSYEHDLEEGPPKAPWHFKLLLVGTILYLIYRLIWFIFWLSHHA
jgi:hypothetical protein